MLFTDPSFLLLFLPILLALYFLAVSVTHRIGRTGTRQGAVANWVLLAGCLVFFVRGAGAFAWVISGAIAFNVWMARLVDRARQGREAFFIVAVVGNVALFGICKYAPSAFDILAPSTGERMLAVPQLLFPFGLSFFVLHAISYVADVYRFEGKVRPRLHQTVAYLLFFPVLVAGPIVRYRDLSSQLNRRRVGMSTFAYGVRRFAIGLGKTFLIGRTLAAQADAAFALPAGELSSTHAWLGATCFTLQIYFELSGYADMAVGLGRMLGYRLRENFRWPYVASTLHEFWQRWNISLFEWLRTYTGLRLEGHSTVWVHVQSVLALMLLVGLWHGPGTNVMAWGLYHGTFLAAERVGLATIVTRLPPLIRHGYLLLVVLSGWVLFRTETLRDALVFLQALAGLGDTVPQPSPLVVTPVVWMALVAGVMGSAPLVAWLSRWRVMLDAVTTSVLMLASTTSIFTWRRGADVVDAARRRRERDSSG